MATTLLIESAPGSGTYVDRTALLLQGSVAAKLNTADFALTDPPAGAAQLTAGVKMTNPTWAGAIASVMTSDPVDVRNGHMFATVTATNVAPLVVDTAPFDLVDEDTTTTTLFELEDGTGHVTSEDTTLIYLSEVTLDATTNYTLEDASGHIMLEDATDWAPGILLTEGALARSYAGLTIRKSTQTTGPVKTLGRCTVFAPGLRPGNLFKLTSVNQGYAGVQFEITQLITQWPALKTLPVFTVEFGDTPQTLADWTVVNAPVPIPAIVAPTIAAIPPATVIYGSTASITGLQTMGAGIVTVATKTFTVNPLAGHTLTCQVLGAIDARMDAWDNYVAAPRRAVRAVLSGGIFTGAWQELPFGLTRATYDLSSAAGLALAAGTYTVSIQIDTVEFNQMRIYSGWVQVAVTG